MNRRDEIVANVKMEECYAGLSLVFDGDDTIKTEIGNAIDKITNQTKMNPAVFDNTQDTKGGKPAFYIEFSDEVQRDSGDFFELVLRELKIDKCVNDVIN